MGPHPIWASLVAQMVKKMPAVQETWVQSLCWEDPVEKEMATHSNILAWRIPWTDHEVAESDRTERIALLPSDMPDGDWEGRRLRHTHTQ